MLKTNGILKYMKPLHESLLKITYNLLYLKGQISINIFNHVYILL